MPNGSKNKQRVGLLLLIGAIAGFGTAMADETPRGRSQHESARFDAIDSTNVASLSGIVLDSLHNEPLSGAQITLSGSTQHASTGVDGRFHIDGIDSGVRDISVSHPFADSVGLALGARSIKFNPRQELKAAFAIPSERGMRRLLCGEEGTPHNRAALVGRVARVGSNAPAAGATVELDWIEVGFQQGRGMVNQRRHLSATTNSDGRYVFCNLADSLDATIRAFSSVDSTGRLTVSLGDRAVAIQYLFLPPNRAAANTPDVTTPSVSAIRGRVVDASGRPLDGATVDVMRGEMSTTTGADGEFSLSRAPMGSQLLRVRRLGYEESVQPIIISASDPNRVTVKLSRTVAALDPVVIRARLSDAATRSGFEARARTGPGRYISAQFLQDHHTRCVFDVIHIDSYILRRGTSICSAGIVPHNRGYSTLPHSIASVGTALDECVELYVDDLPEHADADGISFTGGSSLPVWQLGWLDPRSVVGIELYSRGTAPMRFPHTSSCGLILIWTSQFHGKHS